MRSSLLLASAAAAAADLELVSRQANTSTGSSYLARMADTHIRKGIKLDFGYTSQLLTPQPSTDADTAFPFSRGETGVLIISMTLN
jgi:hypothetical protein